MQDIRFYLKREGWAEQPPGPAGAFWTRNDAAIAVPEVDDPRLTDSVTMHLARVTGKRQADLASEVKYYATDVTDFRAVNDHLDLESIPLSSASIIVDSVRRLIRYCGTTAFQTKGDLKAHYSKMGDVVWRSARMAHTRKGSYIIPVLVRLHLDTEADTRDKLVDLSPPEPVERRVIRTLAQALRAVDQAIVQPAIEPTMERLHTAIEMGVSRDLCVALHSLLKEPIVGALDTTFQWAPAAEISASAPRQVAIPAESRDLIEMAAKKLRNVRANSSRTMTGPIVGLRHTPQTPYGEITISTIRDGRQAEVTIRIPYEQFYRPAIEWHRDRRVLIVEGFVEGGRGHRLYVMDPIRCEPLEDLFAPRLKRPNWLPSQAASESPDSAPGEND